MLITQVSTECLGENKKRTHFGQMQLDYSLKTSGLCCIIWFRMPLNKLLKSFWSKCSVNVSADILSMGTPAEANFTFAFLTATGSSLDSKCEI
jgi:hypothetical protein